MKPKILIASLLFALILISTGFFRLSGFEPSALSVYAGLATPIYVAATIGFGFLLMRLGVEINNFGFATRMTVRHFLLGILGVGLLQLWQAFALPEVSILLSNAEGNASYTDERFSGVAGSVTNLVTLLAFSWGFAALGEEIAFRIVLLRGIAHGIGETTIAKVAAVIIAAIIFGLVHLYKGPVGMVSSTFSGLVFGVLVVTARGAIWPAFWAHGLNNTIGILQIYADG